MGEIAVLKPKAGYPIPDAALDDRLGWIGTSGSGKTYNAGGGVERLLESGARVVIVDPLGVWWGLRLKADGSPSPFSVAIFGGPHGDLPLTEQAGALIGETAATIKESCLIDLSELGSKAADRRFMVAFLEAIYRKAGGEPFHLIVDEADLFAPQKPQKGDEVLLGHMENIVRRGRIKGFIPWLISQRPAVLNKNVLSQVDGLVAFKLTGTQDRDALDAFIEGQADREEGKAIKAALPTFSVGQGVVWVPGRDVLETATFPPKLTFDSSRSPKRGEKRERRDLKPLNLERLKQQLSTVEEEMKANDPKALKTEVALLRREVAKLERLKSNPPPAPPPVVANADDIERARQEGEQTGIAIGIARAQAAIAALDGSKAPAAVRQRLSQPLQVAAPTPAAVVASEGVTGPQQRILNALGWWKAFGIAQPTNEQVGFVAGYSPSSGGFNNLKGQLRSAGLVDYPMPGKVCLTEAGEEKAEAPALDLTQEAFHAQVRAKLSGPQVRVLDPIITAYPEAIGSQEVAESAGYSASSGGFNNLRGSLRTIGLIDYPTPGNVRAADWLFPA